MPDLLAAGAAEPLWTVDGPTLAGADLRALDLTGARLAGADLAGARLEDAVLTDADLLGANLTGADLRAAGLRRAALAGAACRANFFHASLTEADGSGADFREANLYGAMADRARFRQADLRGTVLYAGDFSGADFSGADLRGADLRGANLAGADLSTADLSGARLEGARIDDHTRWPAGLSPRGRGLRFAAPAYWEPAPEAPQYVGIPEDLAGRLAELEAQAWQHLADRVFDRALAVMTEAVGLAEAALGASHPETAVCLNMLMRIHQEAGDPDAGIDPGLRALAILDGHPGAAEHRATVLNNLGLSYYRVGRLGEAEERLREAVDVGPEFANPHYWLARVYRDRAGPGDEEREFAAWARYLELGAPIPARRAEAMRRLDELLA